MKDFGLAVHWGSLPRKLGDASAQTLPRYSAEALFVIKALLFQQVWSPLQAPLRWRGVELAFFKLPFSKDDFPVPANHVAPSQKTTFRSQRAPRSPKTTFRSQRAPRRHYNNLVPDDFPVPKVLIYFFLMLVKDFGLESH